MGLSAIQAPPTGQTHTHARARTFTHISFSFPISGSVTGSYRSSTGLIRIPPDPCPSPTPIVSYVARLGDFGHIKPARAWLCLLCLVCMSVEMRGGSGERVSGWRRASVFSLPAHSSAYCMD